MQTNYLDVPNVASRFNISLNNLYVKLHRGIFPKGVYFKLGRRIYFNEEKLINWLEKGAA